MDRPGRAGSEAGAATRHYGSDSGDPATGPSTALVGVEPISANCVQASIEANELVHVPGPHPSIMVGLNCGMGSAVAWPHIVANVEWFVGVGDDDAGAAMRDLAAAGIVAGETGAASLAGMQALLADDTARERFGHDGRPPRHRGCDRPREPSSASSGARPPTSRRPRTRSPPGDGCSTPGVTPG
ncbi:MAG: pyridoxal-phosphate dependent enzyme [Ilumatobacteraceae bacterium]